MDAFGVEISKADDELNWAEKHPVAYGTAVGAGAMGVSTGAAAGSSALLHRAVLGRGRWKEALGYARQTAKYALKSKRNLAVSAGGGAVVGGIAALSGDEKKKRVSKAMSDPFGVEEIRKDKKDVAATTAGVGLSAGGTVAAIDGLSDKKRANFRREAASRASVQRGVSLTRSARKLGRQGNLKLILGGGAAMAGGALLGHTVKDKIEKNMDPFGIEEIRKGFGVKADEFNRGFKAAKVLRQRKKLGLDRANYGTSAYAINSDLHTDASFSAAARAGAGANQFLHDPATKIAVGSVGGVAAYKLNEKRKKEKVKKNMDPFGVEEIRKGFGKPKISPEKIASLMPKKPSALQTRTNLAASKRMRLQAKKNTQGK